MLSNGHFVLGAAERDNADGELVRERACSTAALLANDIFREHRTQKGFADGGHRRGPGARRQQYKGATVAWLAAAHE